ncbi:hypothetical protein JOF34_001738 [Microbacterium amylolyticum]|uniref:Uncharacterized protein n=1 Tax=Microbacterium amylolyticum TaxID=936337 RepID=A0ABS4ZIQ1_9MICO|nr:hypothetical protein [Microbacterium amylolyticum]
MDPAPTRENLPRVNGGDRSARIDALKDLTSDRIGFGFSEDTGHNTTVNDQMVDVAPVGPALRVAASLRSGQIDDLERTPGCVRLFGDYAAQLPGNGVVGVRGVALIVEQDDARRRNGRP